MTHLLVLLPSHRVPALVTFGCKGTKVADSTSQQSNLQRFTRPVLLGGWARPALCTLRSSSRQPRGRKPLPGALWTRKGSVWMRSGWFTAAQAARVQVRARPAPRRGAEGARGGLCAAAAGTRPGESARAPGRAADGSGTGRVWRVWRAAPTRAGSALGLWAFRWEVRALQSSGGSCERAGVRLREGPGSGAGRRPSRGSRTSLGAARAPAPGRLRTARSGRPSPAATGAGSCCGRHQRSVPLRGTSRTAALLLPERSTATIPGRAAEV